MKYYLFSGNNIVASYENDKLTIINNKLAPLFIQRTGNFVRWVEKRAIDFSRTNSRMLKKAHRMPMLSPDFETAMKYNAASITDNFWVRSADDSLMWEDVRFTDDTYFRMAVSSDDNAFSLKPSRTPELTNIGSREKGWKLEEDGWWLYKKDEIPEVELLTYQIGKSVGFDMAHYEMDGGLIRTKDFTEGKLNLQHMDSVIGENEDYSDNYNMIKDMFPAGANDYLNIIFLDTVMNNPDRHTENFGFLTSQEDGHIVRLAPNYDNDMALYGINEPWFGNNVHNRMIDEFVAFCEKEKIGYVVPNFNEDYIRKQCSILQNGDYAAEYIIQRGKILKESINPDYGNEETPFSPHHNMESGPIWVKSHYRNGRHVRGHWRRRTA